MEAIFYFQYISLLYLSIARNCLYVLQSAGVQFPQSAHVVQANHPSSQPINTNNVPNGEASPRVERIAQQAESQAVPESR